MCFIYKLNSNVVIKTKIKIQSSYKWKLIATMVVYFRIILPAWFSLIKFVNMYCTISHLFDLRLYKTCLKQHEYLNM